MMQRWICYAMILVTVLSMAVTAEEVPAPVAPHGAQQGTSEALEVAQVRFRPVRARPARFRSVRSRSPRFRAVRARPARFRAARFSTIRFRAPRRAPVRSRAVRFRQVQFRAPRISNGGRNISPSSPGRPARRSVPINVTASKARANFAKGLRSLK